MSFLCSTQLISWFPDIKSLSQFFDLVNDRQLFRAKGGSINDWNHLRHIAASLRQISECGPLNDFASDPSQEIELSNLYTAKKPQFYYFFLSAAEEQRTSDAVGMLLLQQLKRVAFRFRSGPRKTIVICDEAQNLFGPTFVEVLELLREFAISLLMLHQSRSQLVTPLADFRDRFDNAIGVQMCLGARTPDDLSYLINSDGDRIAYGLNWAQPAFTVNEDLLIHPQYSYQADSSRHPQLLNVSERIVPKLERNLILQVSADPQAGFVRGFLNEKLRPFNASWVPFHWYHHICHEQFRQYGAAYPTALPSQKVYSVDNVAAPDPPNPFASIRTDANTHEVEAALRKLALEHRKRIDP